MYYMRSYYEKTTFMDKYPVYSLELNKSEIKQTKITELVEYFKSKIEAHPIAKFIAVFDHYSHTKKIDGKFEPNILEAQNVIFCFGQAIPTTKILAIRPRSIGIVEFENSFVIEFLETPNEKHSQLMEDWAKSLTI